MNKLTLGTVQFGLDYGISNASGQVSFKEVEKILQLAKESSIDTLDTATGYGNSEKVLGSIGVNDFQIVTKTAPLHLGVDNVLQSFRRSLDDLKIESVDSLLVHNIEDTQDKQFDSLYKELDKLKRDKLINKIGFSTYTPEEVDFLLNNFDFDVIQVPFNILDKRLIRSGMFDKLANQDVEVHARSIFLQGLLLMDEGSKHKYFNRWKKLWQLWNEWLKDNKLTALEVTTRYVISTAEISKVLVGVNSKKHLQDILQASDGIIPVIPEDLYSDDVDLLNPMNWNVSV